MPDSPEDSAFAVTIVKDPDPELTLLPVDTYTESPVPAAVV